ncbi:Glycosyltransferase involved in cell wall bisynthesis [Bowdeniella nasicola]|uniref:Glycosyltransferase involved in cell wall bisynthesis n=1 Tax=Bowdeniella nasicola TaxID=208480 RepID=A0A1H3VJV5_9ACTO|nr:glycosyltransferase family 4 protein [Bowdeniella nasicola]SDZ74961.1 Glycosyltransferase involved in cell wall bisynthesis [Bowdeniella nasicola]
MRVVIVSPWFPTKKNPSSGAFVVKDAVALSDAGHDIRIVHFVPSHEDDGTLRVHHEGLPVIRIPMDTNNPLSILRASRELPALLKGADVVHTQALSAIEPFVFARTSLPWVHTEHWSAITSPETLPSAARMMLPGLLKMEKLPDVVVAVCEFLARPIREVRGERPVEIIPCQVPAPPRLIERPKPADVLRLISTGAIVERKDPLVAVRTVKELNDRGIATRLTWLGEGPLRAEATELAAILGVDVEFPGTKSAQEVRDFIGESDMFFGPTRADNFFVAAAESIVNGRPLVVGANGGQGEYIDPAVGQTVDRQDPQAYADAIVAVRDRAAHLSARDIADTVGNRFDPETIAQAYTDLYKRVVAAKHV